MNLLGTRKYQNKPSWGDVWHYDSKAERRYADRLELLRKGGHIASWKRARQYELKVRGKIICKIEPDFEITLTDGTKEIHEVKGFKTRDWVIKWKLFDALYPMLIKRIVYAKDV